MTFFEKFIFIVCDFVLCVPTRNSDNSQSLKKLDLQGKKPTLFRIDLNLIWLRGGGEHLN
jgi:hypothetical protein